MKMQMEKKVSEWSSKGGLKKEVKERGMESRMQWQSWNWSSDHFMVAGHRLEFHEKSEALLLAEVGHVTKGKL